ncbi:MAG: hypothetical protein M1814_006365 [Vezdaea aestivalis]|nr:MAG: hypothetical protein M1814_006365 [Vezdaea aestivalis]
MATSVTDPSDPRSSPSFESKKQPNLYQTLPHASTTPLPEPPSNPPSEAPEPIRSLSQPLPSTTSTSTPVIIPTFTKTLSSGFPYNDALFSLNISPTAWFAFSAEIGLAAKPSVAQLLLSISPAIFIVEPITSTLVGRAIWRGQEKRNAKQGIEKSDPPKKKGQKESVGAVLRRWNTTWASLGVQVGLELPLEKVELETVDKQAKLLNDSTAKRIKAEARKFKVVLSRIEDAEGEIEVEMSGEVELPADGEWEKDVLSPKTPGGSKMIEMQGNQGRRGVVELP